MKKTAFTFAASLLTIVTLSACSSPSEPTPLYLYRWDAIMQSTDCQVAKPVPDLTTTTPSYVQAMPDGKTTRVFYATAGGSNEFIGGDFRKMADPIYALCHWERYTRVSQ
jgi:hypothetical protein